MRWTRKNGASRFFLILHTFNIENQNNIVAQNENILKHSSLSSCKDLDNMKNANLASILILTRIGFLSTSILFH